MRAIAFIHNCTHTVFDNSKEYLYWLAAFLQ